MIGWALETFVATSLLMLLVLAVRAPVRKSFGPHMAYALWLLPVARLVLPPLPQSWREQAVAPVAAASDIVAVYFVEPLGAAPSAGAEGSFGLWMAVLLVWALGAAAFLVWHLISHRRYTANLLRAARVDRTIAQGRVRVIETDAAHGPLAFGVFRKYVAFPRDFSERYDELERDLALAHELGHHVRGDLIANWVALIVLALHWFNPIAWKAFRAFRADQEMACDALVLAGRAQALRHAYGRAIVKSAHGGAVSAACHLHTINEVKGRLRMLSKTRQFSPTRAAAGLIGVGALSVAALGLTASGTQAAETLKSKVETVTGMDLGQDMPAPPAPPEAPEAVEAPEAPEPPEAIAAPRHERHVVRFNVQDDDKKDGKKIRKMVIVRSDGSKDEIAMPDMEAIRISVPEIRDGKCGKGEPSVEHRKNGDKNVMIICTDRIEAMSENATRMAMRHKALGMDSARMGLRMARRSIENETAMGAEERARALKGIDEAMAELEKERDAD
ncbi:M56 family metallopeptidase [Sphingomonas sp. DG1-23]|uniref:M56 family metallopeptidase n=1 Tax=Sphingomonas sp. DG1-23 TaxID=3068316 RepID=UPI00273FFDAF|nr:M56 family metallopeptidase [Sphingomonas sp. DG1-23]MDP5279142.1 M56 family metallopeptidase [Sphingomonas sp. DG1-23]